MKMLWAIVIALSFAFILNAAMIDYKIKIDWKISKMPIEISP